MFSDPARPPGPARPGGRFRWSGEKFDGHLPMRCHGGGPVAGRALQVFLRRAVATKSLENDHWDGKIW